MDYSIIGLFKEQRLNTFRGTVHYCLRKLLTVTSEWEMVAISKSIPMHQEQFLVACTVEVKHYRIKTEHKRRLNVKLLFNEGFMAKFQCEVTFQWRVHGEIPLWSYFYVTITVDPWGSLMCFFLQLKTTKASIFYTLFVQYSQCDLPSALRPPFGPTFEPRTADPEAITLTTRPKNTFKYEPTLQCWILGVGVVELRRVGQPWLGPAEGLNCNRI